MKRIVALLLALFMGVMFVGCGKDKETEAETDKATVEKCCRDFVSAYASLDGTTAGALLNGVGEPIEFSDLTGALAANVEPEITVNDVTVDGVKAYVSVSIKNIEIKPVLTAAPATVTDSDTAKQYLISALQKGKNATVTYNVKIQLAKKNGEWKIIMTEELSDALLGGYNSALKELTEGAAE